MLDLQATGEQVDYAKLKGYHIAFSVDASHDGRIAFKFTVKNDGFVVGPERVPQDFKEYFDHFNWYSRDGTVFGSLEPIIDFQQFTLSPDGRHLALNSFHQHATGSLWLMDLPTNTTTALATDPHAQSDPVWSPDSRFVAFNLLPNGGSDPPFLVEKIEIGSQQPQKVYGDNERHWVEDWSRDRRFLLTHDTKTFSIIPLTGDSKPKPLYASTSIKDEFHLSPDGQLIAYGENRTGTWDVFVASFPSFHNIKQVSEAGGAQPRWRGDSRELFFLDLEGK